MKSYCKKLLWLHEHSFDDYKVKTLEYRELQIKLSQHQEHSKDASGNDSIKAPGVLQHFGRGEAHGSIAQLPMDKRFAQGWAASVVQDH